MFEWVLHYIAVLTGIGAAIAFIWTIVQFMLVRRREQRVQEFDAYHQLIKELVQPDPESGTTWLDRQVAVVFELRNFKAYYPVTLRILEHLRDRFASDLESPWSYLVVEMDLTIKHINGKRKT